MTKSRRSLITFALLCVIFVPIGVPYFALVSEGKIPPPDWNAIEQALNQAASAIGGSASAAALLAIAVVVVLAAIAPIIFAARSGDVVTVLVSIVLVAATWLLVFQSRTVIDMTIAAVMYLASMTLSVLVFASTRIVDAIGRQRRETV